METLKYKTPSYLIAIDTSGSCNFSKQFLQEAMKNYFQETSVVLFHREIYFQTSKKYFLDNFEDILKNQYQIAGTDLNPLFNFADSHLFTNLVVITDGYFPLPNKPLAKVEWILTINDKDNINELKKIGKIRLIEDKYGAN